MCEQKKEWIDWFRVSVPCWLRWASPPPVFSPWPVFFLLMQEQNRTTWQTKTSRQFMWGQEWSSLLFLKPYIHAHLHAPCLTTHSRASARGSRLILSACLFTVKDIKQFTNECYEACFCVKVYLYTYSTRSPSSPTDLYLKKKSAKTDLIVPGLSAHRPNNSFPMHFSVLDIINAYLLYNLLPNTL